MNSSLDKAALAIPSTEEDGVDKDEDPAAALKEDGRKQEAEPEEDLQGCH